MQKTSVDLALLILRVALGGIMLVHGLQKLGVFPGGGIQETVSWMGSMGVPAWLAYMSIAAETLGGLGLLIGLFGRLAAFGVAVNMAVAAYLVHWQNGFFNADMGIEFPLALFAMATALMMSGMGGISVDAKLAAGMDRTIAGKKDATPTAPS